MSLFKRRTKPAAAESISAAPVAPEPAEESPIAPENMKVSLILDVESIEALIQQLFYFYQDTAEKLYKWDQCFASNVANDKTGMFDEKTGREQKVFMDEQRAKNKYAWENGARLEDFYWIHKHEESFEIYF